MPPGVRIRWENHQLESHSVSTSFHSKGDQRSIKWQFVIVNAYVITSCTMLHTIVCYIVTSRRQLADYIYTIVAYWHHRNQTLIISILNSQGVAEYSSFSIIFACLTNWKAELCCVTWAATIYYPCSGLVRHRIDIRPRCASSVLFFLLRPAHQASHHTWLPIPAFPRPL